MQNGTRGNSRSLRQSPRTVVTVAILLLTFHLDKVENSSISRKFLRGGGLRAADFGWGLVKLGVPGRDVEAGGEIV